MLEEVPEMASMVGARVEITGLDGESASKNGLRGFIELVRAGGQIVTVELDGGRRFNTRARNLKVLKIGLFCHT
jgi:hypothetical protein